MVCRLWGAEDGTLRAELRGHEPLTPHDYPSMLFTAAFSADGTRLATADKPGRIVIWDVASGRVIRILDAAVMYTWDPTARRHSIGGVRSLAFSPDGTMLAAGGIGQIGNVDHLGAKMRVSLYRAETGEVVKEAEAGEVNGLAERLVFSPDGSRVWAQGGDNKGGWMTLDARTGTVTGEGTISFHVHDFLPGDGGGPDGLAVGHQGMARQRLVPA
jgi:WD40 repeat protein